MQSMTRQHMVCLIGFILLTCSPAHSFSIDGLNSGMTLDEVKSRGGLQATPFFDDGGFQKFNYGFGGFLTFCNGKLAGYEKRLQSVDQALSVVRSAMSTEHMLEDQHSIFISAGQRKYNHIFRWSDGNEIAGIHYFTNKDFGLKSLSDKNVLESNFDFSPPSRFNLYKSAFYDDHFIKSECRASTGP
jgi:hypothetical protein